MIALPGGVRVLIATRPVDFRKGMGDADDLPSNAEALRALLLAERASHSAGIARVTRERDRLSAIIEALQRHRFGRRSERLDPDQLALALEDWSGACLACGSARVC